MRKIKYKTTVYNKANPFGKEVIRTVKGIEVEKPSYLMGCDDCIFIKTEKNKIHIIEPNEIIKEY